MLLIETIRLDFKITKFNCVLYIKGTSKTKQHRNVESSKKKKSYTDVNQKKAIIIPNKIEFEAKNIKREKYKKNSQ